MNVALILAGGCGLRMGRELPKQYLEVGGKPIIEYCMWAFARCEQVDAVQIVADTEWQDLIAECLKRSGLEGKFRGLSASGANRQLSIYNGLEDISRYARPESAVIIHDAARPGLDREMLVRSLEALEAHDGVLPVLPMKDTVYFSASGHKVDGLLERDCIYAGQAPETFRLGAYLEANRALMPEKILKINGSTEPAVLAGLDILMIPGDEGNIKITTMEDLRRFEQNITLERIACKKQE